MNGQEFHIYEAPTVRWTVGHLEHMRNLTYMNSNVVGEYCFLRKYSLYLPFFLLFFCFLTAWIRKRYIKQVKSWDSQMTVIHRCMKMHDCGLVRLTSGHDKLSFHACSLQRLDAFAATRSRLSDRWSAAKSRDFYERKSEENHRQSWRPYFQKRWRSCWRSKTNVKIERIRQVSKASAKREKNLYEDLKQTCLSASAKTTELTQQIRDTRAQDRSWNLLFELERIKDDE